MFRKIINESDRFIWFLRHIKYKFIFGQLSGIGYIGKPLFSRGLDKLFVQKGFGIFPAWRIEISKNSMILIGEDVRIGHGFFADCTSGSIKIGNSVTISANVFIGSAHHLIPEKRDKSFKEWSVKGQNVIIGHNVFIGYGAVILPGSKIGSGAVIGANSVVSGTINEGTIYTGNRSKKEER